MNPMDALLAELDQEVPTTRNLLDSVPEAKYDWRCHEKAMSMSELMGHIAELFTNMREILGGDSFDISQRPDPSAPPADREAVLARFDEAVSGAREWLGGLGDEAFESWRLRRGEDELMAMPRVAAIRSFMFNHHYHHRGQLSAYLRAAGEAVPSVYGPTADVDPFAA